MLKEEGIARGRNACFLLMECVDRLLEKEIVLTRYGFSGSVINLSIAENCHDVNVTCNASLTGLADISCLLIFVFGRFLANGNLHAIQRAWMHMHPLPRLFHHHNISTQSSPASSRLPSAPCKSDAYTIGREFHCRSTPSALMT